MPIITHSNKVTLFNNVHQVVKSEDILIIAKDCMDASDIALKTSKPKSLTKGTMVIVQDLYSTSDKAFKAIRVLVDKKLYYVNSTNLTLLNLV